MNRSAKPDSKLDWAIGNKSGVTVDRLIEEFHLAGRLPAYRDKPFPHFWLAANQTAPRTSHCVPNVGSSLFSTTIRQLPNWILADRGALLDLHSGDTLGTPFESIQVA